MGLHLAGNNCPSIKNDEVVKISECHIPQPIDVSLNLALFILTFKK